MMFTTSIKVFFSSYRQTFQHFQLSLSSRLLLLPPHTSDFIAVTPEFNFFK